MTNWTEGPWSFYDDGEYGDHYWCINGTGFSEIHSGRILKKEDAELIALAPDMAAAIMFADGMGCSCDPCMNCELVRERLYKVMQRLRLIGGTA